MKFSPLPMIIILAVVTACTSSWFSPPEIAGIISTPVLTNTPTPTPSVPTNTSAPVQNPSTPQCRVSADLLKMCTASSPYEQLLTREVIFTPLARNLEGAWLQIQIPKTDQAGWIPADSKLVDCGNLNLAALPVAAAVPDATCSPTPTTTIGVVVSLTAIQPGSKAVTLQIERADAGHTFFISLLRLAVTDDNGKRYEFDCDIPGNCAWSQLSADMLPYQIEGILKQAIDPTAARVRLSLQIDRGETGVPYFLIWQQDLIPPDEGSAAPIPAAAPPEGSIDTVFVSKPYLFLGQGPNLVVLDLTLNPAQPVMIGAATLPPETKITAIDMLGGYIYDVYVMAEGLRIFDVSNPTQPVEVGSYQPPQRAWTGYTTMASPPPPPSRGMDVAVQHTEGGRNYAYVAAYAAGLRVVDVTDPTAPVEVGALEFEPVTAVTGIDVAGYLAYLATQDGLRVVDVSDPTRPVEIAALPAVSWDVALAGDRLYLVEGQCSPLDGCVFGSLQVVDVSHPASPGRIGQTSLFYSQVVALADENIYAGTRNGLAIFRQADPGQPASYWPPTASLLIRDIAINGDYLYLATGDGGLKILNVAEATAPTEVGEIPSALRQPSVQTTAGSPEEPTIEPEPTFEPTEEPIYSRAAAQHFEHGMMIWSEQPDRFYVFFDEDHQFTQFDAEWVKAPDFLATPEPLPAPTGVVPTPAPWPTTPPPGAFEPVSGFGRVWQHSWRYDDNGLPVSVRQDLGWATGPEFEFETAYQCVLGTAAYGQWSCFLRSPAGTVLSFAPQSTVRDRWVWEEKE